MASTSTYISRQLHGSGTAYCGSYPTIKANFTIQFVRQPGEQTVTWSTSGMANWSHPTSGKFGYRFLSYISVNDGSRQGIITKDNTTASSWWNHTSTSDRTGTFTSTSDKTTVKLIVKSNTCMSNGSFCYRSNSGYLTIATITVAIPPYEAGYSVTYNTNGGSPVPEPQQKLMFDDLTLTTIVPTKAANIIYHNSPDVQTSANFIFRNNKWLGSDDVEYAPGALYQTNAACVMSARWDDAVFTPVDLPESYVTVTYVFNGGTGDPASTLVPRSKLGYNTNASATTATYPAGQQATTSTDLSLYPIYGAATLAVSDMPVPIKRGYAFDGWYRDQELTNPIVTALTTNSDTTIYAKWTPIPIHQFNNNTWESPEQYVWKFTNGSWQKIAHVYKFNGSTWIDTSV